MRTIVGLAVAVLLAPGCATKPKPVETPVVEPVKVAEAPPAPAPAPEVAPAPQPCTRDDDCDASSLCLDSRCVPITAGMEACSVSRVHFDFDSSVLREDDLTTLRRMARCLKAKARTHLTIEGNADERGTAEYNLLLGQRRAVAVEKYLETLGVDSEQVRTISYGYEKPLCAAHNEECWQQNRRAALKPATAK